MIPLPGHTASMHPARRLWSSLEPLHDVVYFAPDERHWHGAGPDTFMVHIAITPAISTEGGTDWLEPVTDEEYSGS